MPCMPQASAVGVHLRKHSARATHTDLYLEQYREYVQKVKEEAKADHVRQRQIVKQHKLREAHALREEAKAKEARSASERRVAQLEAELVVMQQTAADEKGRAEKAVADLVTYKKKVVDNTHQVFALQSQVDELQTQLASIDIEDIKAKAVVAYANTYLDKALEASAVSGYNRGKADGFEEGVDQGRAEGFAAAISKAKQVAPEKAAELDELSDDEGSHGYNPSPSRGEKNDGAEQVAADSAVHQEVDQPGPLPSLKEEFLQAAADSAVHQENEE